MLTQNRMYLYDVADFYGFNPPEANLELIARFFEKYPEYSEKAFLVVKVYLVPLPTKRRSE